jgi:hypothetical protein
MYLVTAWLVRIRDVAADIGGSAVTAEREAIQQKLLFRPAQPVKGGGEAHAESHDVEHQIAPVYRCLHIFELMGKLRDFHDYYQHNRLPQSHLRTMMPSDLRSMSSETFLSHHEELVQAAVGFFIIEHKICGTTKGLVTSTTVDNLWKATCQELCDVLQLQLSGMQSTANILQIKDTVTFGAYALGNERYNFPVSPLVAVLCASKQQFERAALAETQKLLHDIFEKENYQPVQLATEEAYAETVIDQGLLLDEDSSDEGNLAFPKACKFTQLVPDACKVLHQLLNSSVKFCENIGIPGALSFVAGILEQAISALNDTLSSLVDPKFVKYQLGRHVKYQ